jgi:anaerobic selenocysteine-containing dehydrogenase
MDEGIHPDMDRVIKTVCSACDCGCGVIVHVKDGYVVKITGDRSHPVNSGRLCLRGMAGIELLYHPDRLNFPLKRTGERGDEAWERISWDEALSIIAGCLSEYIEEAGPASICAATGSGFYENIGIIGQFAYHLGTPNVLAGGYYARKPAALAALATIGHADAVLASPVSQDEVSSSRCVLLWGDSLKREVPHLLTTKILEMREKGGFLVVIDPMPTSTAQNADIWLQIRPGTDDALALGMLHIVINEGLYDRAFVSGWTLGFEALKRHVKVYTPDYVAGICGIPREDLVRAATIFATSRPSCICQRVPLSQSANPVQTSRAILLLDILCGNLDVPGGNLLPKKGMIISEEALFNEISRLPLPVLEQRIGAEELPLLSGPDAPCGIVNPNLWAEAVVAGKAPIRALITCSSSYIPGTPSSRLFRKALGMIDFSVAMDLFPGPPTEFADIVLPAACWLEKDGIRGHYGYPYVVPVQHRAVDPLHERWDETRFLIELARRLELPIPWSTTGEYIDYRLRPAGVAFSELDGVNYISMAKEYYRPEKGTFRFGTPSEKVELTSGLLARYGYDPLPVHVPPPATSPEFPVVLIWGRKEIEYVCTAGNQIRMYRGRLPDPRIEMGPETAAEYGIAERDWVSVETDWFGRRTRFVCKARVVKGFLKNVVAADHGWWHGGGPEEKDPDAARVVSMSGKEAVDPVYGPLHFRSIPCRIYPI